MRVILSLSLALFFTTLSPATARSIPAHTSLVIDEAGVLDASERETFARALTAYQEQYGPQIQLLIIRSLEGDSLEDFSIRVVDAWKLGKKGKDDGVLFLVVVDDRKMRIEVGRGLEGQLPDVTAGRILDREVRPRFRAGAYSEGIMYGLQGIAQSIGGELFSAETADLESNRIQRKGIFGSFWILFFMIAWMFIAFKLRRRRGFWHGGRGRGGYVWTSGGGSSGWGGSSSGSWGGGFGGGGGGGFSGGGASSSW